MTADALRDRSISAATAIAARVRIAYPLLAFAVAAAGLLATVFDGSPRGIELTTDAAALEVAGRSTLGVVGYVDFGQQHLYVTVESLLLLGVASGVAVRDGVATIGGVLIGVGALSGLVVVTGCPCGSGSATALWRAAG